MDISPKDIIIPIATAILGVALPLLLGVIQRIDEKYESTRLMKQFINERATKCFGGILVATILLLFYLLIAPPNKNDFGIFTQYVNNSAVIIATVACVLLCFSFFKVIWLIYIYHNPINLQEHLLKGKIKIETRQAWFEFFVSMLKQDNVNVLSKGFGSLYEWCAELRKGNEWKEIQYPKEFYDGIIALNEKLCSQKKKVVSISNGNDALKIFFDDMQLTIIHPLTFNKIWIGLNQQLYYNRKDLILEYWGAAHQHFSFYMEQYYEGERITHLSKTITITREQAALRHKSRMDFKEFHIAFGGLLLYKKEYELLNHILFYTNTQPPVYPLIPGRLSEIIPVYMELLSFKPENVMKYESRYPFIDLHDGIRNDNIINGYIQRYLILTMFRLFQLIPAYTSDNFFELPGLPSSLSDKQEWINSIPILIEKLEKDTTIPEIVEKILPMEAGELYMAKKKLISLSESLLENLKTAMIQQKESLPLSQEKTQKFSHTISKMIEYEFSTYWSIFPQISVEDDAMPSNYIIHDALIVKYEIEPTEAYADDQTMGYSNLDEVLAQNIILEFRYKWLWHFARQKSQSYNLTANKVAEALKKMNLNKEKHVILGFRVNWYCCFQELEKCDESKLVTPDGIVLYDLPGEYNTDFNNVIVIMNKEDLPQLLFKKPEVLETEKYKLECINQKYNLYASILKLNENPDLMEKFREIGTHTEKQLKQSVLISAEMNVKVAWRLNIKMVLIKISDSHKGNDDLSNITPFENDEK